MLVHQALLSTVIGKHSIFAQFGLTAPILVVLRSLEAIIDVSFWYFIHHGVYSRLMFLFFIKSLLPLLWLTWFPLAKRVCKLTSPTWISLWATALNSTSKSVFQVYSTRQPCPYVSPFKCGNSQVWLGNPMSSYLSLSTKFLATLEMFCSSLSATLSSFWSIAK